MRTIIVVWCALTLTDSASAAIEQGRPPARHKLWTEYRHKVFNGESAARSVASGGIDTALNYPHEWGQGAGGFAKRVGSAFGQHVVAGTIEVGVGMLRHEDLHYHRSNEHGTWPRLKYAVKSTFIVPRTNKSGKTLATGRIVGNMSAGLISRSWQPASAAGVGAGLASGGIALAGDVGLHVAHEFWPQKRHHNGKA